MKTSDLIEVDGLSRSKLNSYGFHIDVTDDGIRDFWRWFGDSSAVDELGRPIIVYHGTACNFDTFSNDFHRTVLNEKYHGDGFHFSPVENVAEKYAEANRNQSFNKLRMFAAVEREFPSEISELFKNVVEKGYSEAWELPDEEIKNLIKKSSDLNIDINSFLDLAEFVEGSNYNKGNEIDFDAGIIFGGTSGLPDWAKTSAREFGLSDAVPVPRVIAAYIKADNVLQTKSQAAASKAHARGYDGVLFGGSYLVDGAPEWVVFNPDQVKSIDLLGAWLSSNEKYQMPGSPQHLSTKWASWELHEAKEGGKNEGSDVSYDSLTANSDGCGWVRVNIPLVLIRDNELGECYDSTTDLDLAKKYSEIDIKTPVDIVYGSRLKSSGLLTAAVNDGGHRVSAARLKGETTIPAILKRSQYRLLLEANGMDLDPCVIAEMKNKKNHMSIK